jgi:lipopolysaccharide export system protein LptA
MQTAARIICTTLLALFFLTDGRAQTTMVYLEHSETLSFEEERIPDAQILRGNVRFRHEDMLMFCDSAYFYERTNSVTAFSNVRFEQGDTLHGYGDILYYDGNTKLARLCRNVRLIHRTTVLTTDSLNYDRQIEKAYYFTGGIIRDSLNSLASVWGEYNPPTNQAVFRRQVHLDNPSFILDSETLNYNTQTHIAQLTSPTTIVYEDETTIRSSNGTYNTSTDESLLYDRSTIVHKDGQSMTGDTIHYDKQQGFGQLTGHLILCDSTQSVTLYGNYGEMHENERHCFVTDSALAEEWSGEDHSWLHADTLFYDEHPCTGEECTDTTYRTIRARHYVRAWSKEYQMVCDSMTYSTIDSTLVLYGTPVFWNGDNQFSADSITVYFKDNRMDHASGKGHILGSQLIAEGRYNQIIGQEMTAYVREGDVRQVDVSGEAQTAFYPRDDKGGMTGLNKTGSNMVQIYLENREIHHILFTTATTGTLFPLDQIAPDDTFLPGFFRADDERPVSVADLFRHPERTTTPVSAATNRSTPEPETESDSKITTKKLK